MAYEVYVVTRARSRCRQGCDHCGTALDDLPETVMDSCSRALSLRVEPPDEVVFAAEVASSTNANYIRRNERLLVLRKRCGAGHMRVRMFAGNSRRVLHMCAIATCAGGYVALSSWRTSSDAATPAPLPSPVSPSSLKLSEPAFAHSMGRAVRDWGDDDDDDDAASSSSDDEAASGNITVLCSVCGEDAHQWAVHQCGHWTRCMACTRRAWLETRSIQCETCRVTQYRLPRMRCAD
jgi:hypothetical protein